MSRAQKLGVAFLTLLLLGEALLFLQLGTGPIEVYDEGLYGMYAQNALHYDTWLHAVDTKGAFPTGAGKFSKPPLAIWLVAGTFQLLGPTLVALRLPFALASLLVAVVCFAWGLRLEAGDRGLRLGGTWAVLWLVCHGTYHYGRTATIEPVLVAFVMLALYAHARALALPGTRQLPWAALSALSLAGAFFTKQLVFVLALAPIGMVELVRLRSRFSVGWFLRVAVVLGVPLCLGLSWIAWVWLRVGQPARAVLWQHAVVNRVSGYDGLHHHNHISRVAEQLDLDAAPLSWQLGILGMTLFVVQQLRRRSETRADALLLAGGLFAAWLAFDVGSHSILPWYVMTLLPGLAFGNAWLVTCAWSSLSEEWPTDRLQQLTAGGGAAALVWLGATAARAWMPSLLAAAVVATVIAWCAREPRPARYQLAALGGVVSVLVLLGSFLRASYGYTESDRLAVLGAGLSRHRVKHVSLDTRVRTHGYTRVTFFGSIAEPTAAPWNLTERTGQPFDARVELAALPREVTARKGVGLLRAAGAYAIWGDMRRPPFDESDVARALDRAPLTFEAEDMASDRYDTRQRDAKASGGAVRSIARGVRSRTSGAHLVTGPTIPIPPGEYMVTFWLKRHCAGFQREVLGEVSISASSAGVIRRSRSLTCRGQPQGGDRYLPLEVPLELRSSSPLMVTLTHNQGTIALDRMTVARQGGKRK